MNKQIEKKPKDIMYIIGVFFAVFATTLFIAIVYTDSERGKIVNLICGLIFIVSSAVSFLLSKKKNT